MRWWFLFTAFVVYGSLVPLDYRPLPPGEAWARFQQIPFLNLGVGSRADWIANGVLYAPLGFLGTLALLQRGWWRPVALVLAVGAAWALAVAVEYTQLFFPPRTVSLNDLLAEAIGSTVGALAALWAWSTRARWRPLRQAGSHWLHDHGLALYVAVYLAYGLFPYDVLISGAELVDKLASDLWGWWLAGGDGRPLVTAVRLGIEVLLAAPLGAWLAARWRLGSAAPAGSAGSAFSPAVSSTATTPTTAPTAGLVVAGLAIGLGLELAQLLIASGVTQGASVLTRAGGVWLGAWLWARRDRWTAARLQHAVRRAAPWVLPAYLLVLLGVNGWFSHAWGGLGDAAETLAGVRWQPFYYHYYTTEAQALLSLTSVAFSYAPLGLWAWARRSPALAGALSALLLCAVVEAGKLFLAGLRPDPTNLAIAALAAGLVAWAAERWRLGIQARAVSGSADPAPPRPSPGAGATIATSTAADEGRHRGPQASPTASGPAAEATSAPAPAGARASAPAGPSFGSLPLWLLAAGAIGWHGLSAPPLAWASALVVAAAAGVIAWRPAAAVWLLLAALPLWDLAPWTGRLLWDEFDLLMAVGLAVAWARTPRPHRPSPPLWRVGFGLLAVSLAISAAIGFWPGAAPDANALASYHGPYNALRIVKGLLWAALFVGLWRRLDAAGHDVPRRMALGMGIGLAGVVLWLLWERSVFVGWADLGADYRVTGPFSAMHRGGAFVECYIAVAMPFVAQAVFGARSVAWRVAAAALLAAGSLAMMLTFSRNGYAALVVALGVWAVFALRARAGRGPAAALGLAGVLGLVAAVAWPVLSGDYAQERLSRWQQDLGVRVAHWQAALALRDDSVAMALLGVGLGRFPELHYWQTREAQRAARLRVESSPRGAGDARDARGVSSDPPAFLRLGGGALTYLDQIVRPVDVGPHTLSLRLRGRAAEAALTVSVCQKWMLTSADCVAGSASAGPVSETWTAAEIPLDLGPLVRAWPPRPIKLALHAPSGETVVDVAGLSLTDANGRELLRNGDFSSGFDGWWMSTDVDPPYHVHSLPVAVLLEQGWLGVAAWALLFTVALAAGAQAAWAGRAQSAVAVAALAGFLVSASLNTLIDDPRFLLLVLLLAASCVAAQTAAGPPASRVRHGRSRSRHAAPAPTR